MAGGSHHVSDAGGYTGAQIRTYPDVVQLVEGSRATISVPHTQSKYTALDSFQASFVTSETHVNVNKER